MGNVPSREYFRMDKVQSIVIRCDYCDDTEIRIDLSNNAIQSRSENTIKEHTIKEQLRAQATAAGWRAMTMKHTNHTLNLCKDHAEKAQQMGLI